MEYLNAVTDGGGVQKRGPLVHPFMRIPAGMWVVRGPYEVLVGVDAGLQELGDAATAALDRSGVLTEAIDTRKAQDGELIRAAGFKSRKQFVAGTAMCTLRCDDGPTVSVRGATKAAKGSSWLPDEEAIEVDVTNRTGLAEAISSLLLR
ncbi:hypothetical protein ACFVWG_25585 [Kribbella sp. NPDC058245]|uniref:hypothetical protein n=1 Tax=Kribbella sp. NPDC058245 TaxID=3346399 RepID=UPI0036E1A397